MEHLCQFIFQIVPKLRSIDFWVKQNAVHVPRAKSCPPFLPIVPFVVFKVIADPIDNFGRLLRRHVLCSLDAKIG